MASISSPVLKTGAVIGSSFLAGSIASINWMTLPALGRAPASLLADQWRKAFWMGAGTMPPHGVSVAALWAFLAWRSPAGSNTRTQYTLAAVLIPSIIPYTMTIMKPINTALFKRADDLAGPQEDRKSVPEMMSGEAKERTEEESTAALVKRWGWFNLARAGLVVAGTLVGAWPIDF